MENFLLDAEEMLPCVDVLEGRDGGLPEGLLLALFFTDSNLYFDYKIIVTFSQSYSLLLRLSFRPKIREEFGDLCICVNYSKVKISKLTFDGKLSFFTIVKLDSL